MTQVPVSEDPELTTTDLPRRFLTVSNLLSLLRLMLSLPFALVMTNGTQESRLWGAAIMVLAALTDKLDGYAARKFGQTSQWGKILDPLADKVAVGTVLIVLYLLGDLPLWFLLIGIGRDFIIVVGGLYLRRKTGILTPSNLLGKWTVGIVALLLFVLVLGGEGIATDLLLILTTTMMILSFFQYGTRFLNLLKMHTE